ncbi:MAG: FAD binding domain-containing protein [Betaproteobacteria bacterium]|jgi:carbon-monoxide dehydrogenase medium subunit|nr:FAD binding domain-containing protein [Betaproteobacteria bacterium]
MKPAPFKYHDPRSVKDLVGLLASLENAKLLAGGQSLGPMLNFRYLMPDHLIDLNRIAELAYIRPGADTLEIGAMTRQRTLEHSQEVQRTCPVLVEALHSVGHIATRNRGTIGGSLSHLDPAAELPGVCALHDAMLTVAGPNGTRSIAMAEWGVSFMTPNLEPNEVLTGVTLKAWREPHGYAFVELARRQGDFAMAGVGCLVALDGNSKVRRIALSLIGVTTTPVRLSAAEKLLTGSDLAGEAIKAAAAEIGALEALDDAHATGTYRKRLAGVMLGRAIGRAAERARMQGSRQ